MKHRKPSLVRSILPLAAFLAWGAPEFCRAETITTPPVSDANTPTKDVMPRDPFWPPGYVPRVVAQRLEEKQHTAQEQAQAKALVQWPTLALAGITKTGNRNIGLIQDVGLVESGDVVRVSRDGVVYKWQILAVSDEGLSCLKLSATPIPLKTPGTAEPSR